MQDAGRKGSVVKQSKLVLSSEFPVACWKANLFSKLAGLGVRCEQLLELSLAWKYI